jgi:hypothetical protein
MEGSWEEFLNRIAKRKKFVLKGLLEVMRGGFDGENFIIRCEFQTLLDKLQEADKWHIIEETTREIFGKPVDIILQKEEPGTLEEEGSANDREDLENKVLSDPVVIELLREFPGSRIADIVKMDPKKKKGGEGILDREAGLTDEMGGISADFIEEEEEEED